MINIGKNFIESKRFKILKVSNWVKDSRSLKYHIMEKIQINENFMYQKRFKILKVSNWVKDSKALNYQQKRMIQCD